MFGPLIALERPRSFAPRAQGLLRALSVTLFYSAVLVVANLLQVCTLLVWPFSRSLFVRANRAIAREALTRLGGVAERLHRLQVISSGDALPRTENAVVIANHQTVIDVNCVFCLAWRHGRLGDLKWFAKASVRHLPGIGWGLRFLEPVFVARRWERDRDSIARVFAKMKQDPAPFWLLMFSEGHRRRAEAMAESRARAAAEGRRPLEHLLPPRTRGFVATIGALREHAQAVYDLTIGYPDGVPTLWDLQSGYVRRVHLHVRRFPLSDLPLDEPGLEAWLSQRWAEKDQLLAAFAADGRFPGEQR
ncbi:MAG: acyltransferase [Deltaproteobacteria bacterium]|nr:acyltransferase [Deltaproteobacteria bacterium]